jgi:NAD(P)-dependent dehydrogenase (short-subunit alcohol dehydrogenase family)
MRQTYSLVTGASGGIGQAVVRELSASGRVILSGRSIDRLEAIRSECGSPEGHLVWATDLADSATCGVALASFLNEHDAAIEHFVHCAGVFDVRLLRMIDWDDAYRMFNVNVFSAIEIIRQLSRKRVNGQALRTITLISSIASRIGTPGYHLYAASKGALNALARSLAVELAPEVRVNCVLPGGVETESTRAMFANEETLARMKASTPLGLGTVGDIASAVAFLVSDKARWITGQEIVIDGGRSIV